MFIQSNKKKKKNLKYGAGTGKIRCQMAFSEVEWNRSVKLVGEIDQRMKFVGKIDKSVIVLSEIDWPNCCKVNQSTRKSIGEIGQQVVLIAENDSSLWLKSTWM